MSEEMEHRIERSLLQDGRLYSVLQLIGGQDMVMFASMMSGDLKIAIRDADAKVGGAVEWYDSPEKLDLVCAHMQEVIARTVSTFARMCQTGVADRAGQHVFQLGRQ